MYDKTVRRRRAVLGLLVAGSLILLTAYFGESAGGGLHSVQRGVRRGRLADPGGREPRAQARARPRSAGSATRFDAKGEVKELRAERDALRAAGRQPAPTPRARTTQLREPARPRQGARPRRRRARWPARVIGQVAERLVRDGRDRQGHERRRPASNQPVVNARGPRRRVTTAVVELRRSSRCSPTTRTAVGARVAESGVGGVIVQVETGRPQRPPDAASRRATTRSRPGDRRSPPAPSRARTAFRRCTRRGIPIGRVTRVDDPGTDDQQVHVAPVRQHAPPRLRPGADPHAGQRPRDRRSPRSSSPASSRSASPCVILQIAAVSQIRALRRERRPLAARRSRRSGCCAARSPGACFGFGVGPVPRPRARADARPVVARATSRSATAPGGCASCATRRARSSRSRSAPRRRAVATIGYSRDAVPARRRRAGQLRCCVRRSLATILLNALIALPVYALVRRWLLPALPEDPRRRRRRAYTTGGLSPLEPRMSAFDGGGAGRGPPITPQLALRVAILGVRRVRAVRDRLLPPLVPAGALRRPVPAPGARQPRARAAHPGAARRRSSTATATSLVENRVATVVQIDPERLPVAERDAAATWGQQVTARDAPPEGPEGPADPDPAARRRRTSRRASSAWAAC